jgi:hypothetical protein
LVVLLSFCLLLLLRLCRWTAKRPTLSGHYPLTADCRAATKHAILPVEVPPQAPRNRPYRGPSNVTTVVRPVTCLIQQKMLLKRPIDMSRFKPRSPAPTAESGSAAESTPTTSRKPKAVGAPKGTPKKKKVGLFVNSTVVGVEGRGGHVAVSGSRACHGSGDGGGGATTGLALIRKDSAPPPGHPSLRSLLPRSLTCAALPSPPAQNSR